MVETEVVIVRCPICDKPFQVPTGEVWPTCGDPGCIREARSRGLPIAVTKQKLKMAKKAPKTRQRK